MSSLPPEIPDLPPAPIRNQAPADFSRIASTFVGAMNPWGQSINAVAAWIRGAIDTALGYAQVAEQARDDAGDFSQESYAHSQDSLTYAQNASQYASSAAANANFVGEWAGLTGALPRGRTVYYNGTYWHSLRDISNVAASEPSTSNADWAPAGASIVYPPAGLAVSSGTGWGDSLPVPDGELIGTTDEQEITRKTLGAGTRESVALVGAISITDASAPFQQITLTANAAASINLSVGVTRTVWINPGAHTPTWPAGMEWVGDEEPVLPASKWSCLTFTGIPGNTAGLAALFWSDE